MLGPGIAAYLILSVVLFATGAFGVLIRRSPLIILLALELMLNAGNLALIAFARQLGNADGQIFALTVMVVAAAEAVLGLGLIVAVSRKRVELDVDRLTSLQGLAHGRSRLDRPLRPRRRRGRDRSARRPDRPPRRRAAGRGRHLLLVRLHDGPLLRPARPRAGEPLRSSRPSGRG